MARQVTPRAPKRALPPESRVTEALSRLAGEGALQTLVRGALPTSLLRRLFEPAMPRRTVAEMPEEVWSGLAAGIAAESPLFGLSLAQALHDRLAWDREPAGGDEWERAVRERPLEALWMAAISDTKAVRKAFARTAVDCLRAYRASPACTPPSWEFVDGLLEVQASGMRELRETEKMLEDAGRRFDAERQRAEDLREELKRLRRENSDLRAEKAQAERRAAAQAARAEPPGPGAERLLELERRLRKAEKENEHLRRETARLEAARVEHLPPAPEPPRGAPPPPGEGERAESGDQAIALDGNPRRRVLRQMLRKLFNKGKIGASHTHEDNVYRGVPDHEKGIAKEAMELLSREGLLLVKPTATDPHVSLSPDHAVEVQAIIAGEIQNPRLRRFVGEEG